VRVPCTSAQLLNHDTPQRQNPEPSLSRVRYHCTAERINTFMKKTFVIFLCCVTLLYSCYPYSPLTREELNAQVLPAGEKIRVILADGSIIKSQPYHHISTTEPAGFIYGSGKRYSRFSQSDQKDFVGRLERASIDSLKLIGQGSMRYLLCYPSDSTEISFLYGEYVIVSIEQPPGLWCAGIQTSNGNDSIYSGRIPQERIERIEIEKYNALRTIGAITLVTVIVVAGIVAIAASSINVKLGKLE
jgi:hypothetical protein